jgi:hypothetical protein
MIVNKGWTLLIVTIGLLTSEMATRAQEPQPASAFPAAAKAPESVEDIARQVDQSAQAKEITAGILTPIYKIAEQLSFPMFHWVAFAVMTTGVVSFALQLVLAKLVVLLRMSISLSEIFSDALGLTISAIGLVLTTQAAAQNSTFTQSPASVLSATAVGVVAGFVFYLWGQRQEVQAAQARAAIADVPVVVRK